MKPRLHILTALTALILPFLLAASDSRAETTPFVNYQGKLTKKGKNENGQINATFKIFTGATNTDCVFEESQQIAVVDGFYSTLIGQYPAFGSIEEACRLDDAYLEITINNQTLTPREKFCPPPFAGRSKHHWTLHAHSPGVPLSLDDMTTDAFGPVVQWNITGWTNYWILFPPGATQLELVKLRIFVAQGWGAPATTNADVTLGIHLFRFEGGIARTITNNIPLDFKSLSNDAQWFSLPLPADRTSRLIPPDNLLYVSFQKGPFATGTYNVMCEAELK